MERTTSKCYNTLLHETNYLFVQRTILFIINVKTDRAESTLYIAYYIILYYIIILYIYIYIILYYIT